MKSVSLHGLMSDEAKKAAARIREVAFHISWYPYTDREKKTLAILLDEICEVCSYWTGKTYIGEPKKEPIKSTFQGFFTDFMRLLLILQNSEKPHEVIVANELLYQGAIFRYMGKNYPNKRRVRPKYNDIYVSWSKAPKNSYIESKLYGPITWLSGEIKKPFYGIDLGPLGCVRANEQEVVFPMHKDCIQKIKYI